MTKNRSAQGYEVLIAGSETLLNPDYLKAYSVAGQKYLLTNGILLLKKPELFDKLHKHGIEELTVSLHSGIQKTLRSAPEKTVLDFISAAKICGFRVKISTTICQKNYATVTNMCDSAHNAGADGIKFIRYINTGKAKSDLELRTLNTNELTIFFNQVNESRDKYPTEQLEIIIHGNFGPRPGSKRGMNLSKNNLYCTAGIDIFAITPNNKVYGCPFLMDQPIGKLKDNKIIVTDSLGVERKTCLADCIKT